MANGRIPKDVLDSELVTGTGTVGQLCLRYKDTCKCNMKVAGVDINTWENVASDCGKWRSVVKPGKKRGDDRRRTRQAERRDHRNHRSACAAFSSQLMYVCHSHRCGRDCHA